MRNSTKVAGLSILIAGGASVAISIFPPNIEGKTAEQSTLIYSLIGLIIFLGTNYWLFLESVRKARKSIERKIGDSFSIELRGIPKNVMPDLNRDIISAEHIKNTFVGTKNSGTAKTYSTWLSNPENGVWEDIVGMPEYFSERYNDIACEAGQHAQHRVFVLREFSHIINFIILSFPSSRPDVVYFGWIANDERGVSRLLSSSDKHIVKMFDQQFENLKKLTWNRLDELDNLYGEGFEMDHSYPLTEKATVSPSLVNKSGYWETVAFHQTDDGLVLGSFAVVSVKFGNDRVDVDASVFSPDGEKTESFTANHDATFKLNNIYFLYRMSGSSTTGLCHYKFSRHSSGNKVLTGTFCDTGFNRRNTVVGVFRDETISSSEYTPQFTKERISKLLSKLKKIDPENSLRDGPNLGLMGS